MHSQTSREKTIRGKASTHSRWMVSARDRIYQKLQFYPARNETQESGIVVVDLGGYMSNHMLDANVQQLRDYAETLGVRCRIELCPDLSYDNPGSYKKGVIKIYDMLTSEQQLEAEAHELSHAILERRGVISIDIVDQYYLGKFSEPVTTTLDEFLKNETDCTNDFAIFCDKYIELSEAICNAIHHKPIAEMLNSHSISQTMYYELLERLLKSEEIKISQGISDEVVCRATGVFLYDISNTMPTLKEEISRIAAINPTINESYVAACIILDNIDIRASSEEQFHDISRFFSSVGVDPEGFCIYDAT